jgi:hypothetical protein
MQSNLFLSDINKAPIIDRFSKNIPIFNFMTIRPVAAELCYVDGQTRHEANSRFSQLSQSAPSQGPAPTYKEQNRDAYVYTRTCMPRVEFKPRIPMFERLTTVNASHCAVATTGPPVYLHR